MDRLSESNTPVNDELRKAPTVDGTRSHLQPAQVVAKRYEILRRLGSGQMGEVWHAYDVKLRVDVALKSVRRSSAEAVEALRHEVRIAREVISPNVCRIFDLVEKDGQEYVSMEYIDGVTLLELLREKSPLDLPAAYEIASQFLSGLEAIHQAGLVHRDLKPENIMITRTGRAVVMDFGITERATEIVKYISGTPPYMAPEQLNAIKADVRSDIFAAGVVLAEMISTIRDRASREIIWKELRMESPKARDGPWKTIIARAVAENPNHRFQDVRTLAASLEGAILKLETTHEKNPYPGLSPFKQQDAQYFFGRELELETILKKLKQFHLLAMIGPSGAGKTSFLHAALIPALPSNWNCAFTQPGDSPFVNLAQAVGAEISAPMQTEAHMLLQQWRRNHSEVLLIVDRFEELFTLNDAQTQSHFAELIGRAAVDLDIHILLVMRDDFLIACKEHFALAPIFSDLTALLPLTGAALRRALIQPALQCGYRFEDSSLVEEILSDVEKERGALPLMAFAAARLWERRDRDRRLLTRSAYHQIGGVGGALAQHAEAVMEKIGPERELIVREIFRSLVTSQNTRAARDAEELLSIFENPTVAEDVLRTLIDSRLLTSFELSSSELGKSKKRIEIIHESLLAAWPRLIRWQTQDADSAQFRDQLHQAAHVWAERGKPADLLWTGGSYKEFEVWRTKYSGGLTNIEKAFSEATVQHARRQRLKRSTYLSTIFIVLLTLLGVIASFWRGEKRSREQAVLEAQRAEASKLLALGQKDLEKDPTIALTYAIASLQKVDTPVARRFALEALWKGPPAFVLPDVARPTFLNFSPKGKWLAVGGAGVQLLPRTGGKPSVLYHGEEGGFVRTIWPRFSANEEYLAWSSIEDLSVIHVWSIPQQKEIRRFKFEGETFVEGRENWLILITPMGERHRIRTWAYDHKEPRIAGDWTVTGVNAIDLSKDASLLAYARKRKLYLNRLKMLEDGPDFSAVDHTPDEFIGSHDHDILMSLFHPNGKEIVSVDSTGEIRMWSLYQKAKDPIRKIPAKAAVGRLFFNSTGSIFAAGYLDTDRTLSLWDMNAPKEAAPFNLRRNVQPYWPHIFFHPTDGLAVVPYTDSIAFWPLKHAYPYVLHHEALLDEGAPSLAFSNDGAQLISSFNMKGIRIWDLEKPQSSGRDVWTTPSGFWRTEIDKAGKYIAVGTSDHRMYLISLADGTAQQMPASQYVCFMNVAMSSDARYVSGYPKSANEEIHIWDTQTDRVQILKGTLKTTAMRFSPDGNFYSGSDEGSLVRWDLKTGKSKLLAKGNKLTDDFIFPRNAPYLMISLWSDRERTDHQKARSELKILDLRSRKWRPITTHGDRVSAIAVDPNGTILVTGDLDGIVRVGPISGEEPHLLFGHKSIRAVAIDPKLRRIASSEFMDPIVRVWLMPTGKPLHTLSHDEFLKKLSSLTNLRIVSDQTSSTGYRIQFDRFRGWEELPTW